MWQDGLLQEWSLKKIQLYSLLAFGVNFLYRFVSLLDKRKRDHEAKKAAAAAAAAAAREGGQQNASPATPSNDSSGHKTGKYHTYTIMHV